MEAQEILKLIETVSPDDTAKLDEIDARAWCWLNGVQFLKMGKPFDNRGKIVPRFSFKSKGFSQEGRVLNKAKYTRSRDALKSIRPEGYVFNLYGDDGSGKGVRATLTKWHIGHGTITHDQTFNAWLIGKTEELAELHAVIQAISHERQHQADGGG